MLKIQVDQAASTKSWNVCALFFACLPLKRLKKKKKSLSQECPGQNISTTFKNILFYCLTFFFVAGKNVLIGAKKQTTKLLHELSKIFSSSIQCCPLKLNSQTQLCPIPITHTHENENKNAHRHTKWELTPSKRMVSYTQGPHFLLQPQPPRPKRGFHHLVINILWKRRASGNNYAITYECKCTISAQNTQKA